MNIQFQWIYDHAIQYIKLYIIVLYVLLHNMTMALLQRMLPFCIVVHWSLFSNTMVFRKCTWKMWRRGKTLYVYVYILNKPMKGWLGSKRLMRSFAFGFWHFLTSSPLFSAAVSAVSALFLCHSEKQGAAPQICANTPRQVRAAVWATLQKDGCVVPASGGITPTSLYRNWCHRTRPILGCRGSDRQGELYPSL